MLAVLPVTAGDGAQWALAPVKGQPLLAYSVASARAAKCVTRVVVVTQDDAVAAAARTCGADVRPASAAGPTTNPAADHTLARRPTDGLWQQEHDRPDVVVHLSPSTPLRPRGLVDRAVSALVDGPAAERVCTVLVPGQSQFRLWRGRPDGTLEPLGDDRTARQDQAVYLETGHVDAALARAMSEPATGVRVRPLPVDPAYCLDVSDPVSLGQVARALDDPRLEIDWPAPPQGRWARDWPEKLALVVFDFDGVFTDNKVAVREDGTESVTCDRSDGLGLVALRRQGVPIVVLSTEENPVVAARCRKLGIPCQHGLADKESALVALAGERGVDLREVVYVGNDVNDLGCMRRVGFAVAVADAYEPAKRQADLVLGRPGGKGAVREFCDLVMQRLATPPATDARSR